MKNIKKLLIRCYTKLYIYIKGKNAYLIKKGAKIGENTRIISSIKSFGNEPFLIEIGRDCLLSDNICFMTHDGGMSVLNNLGYYEHRMDKLGRIKVGNNTFIGGDSYGETTDQKNN